MSVRYPRNRVMSSLIMILAAAGLMTVSCGVVNPSLVGTVGGSTVNTLDSPQGTVLIMVLNQTTSEAAVAIEVTKTNGGTMILTVPVLPFDNDTADDSDHQTLAQDCDVRAIQLREVIASIPATGGVQQFAADRPPLILGTDFNCGNVVVFTIVGEAPNLFVNIDVF